MHNHQISDTLIEAIKEELPWPSDDEDKPESRHKQTTASNPIQSRPTSPDLPQTLTPNPAYIQSRIEQP